MNIEKPVAITRTYTQRIEAQPDEVFPLLCPVREAEWLDGWTYEMVHSDSGFAEKGCVFKTQSPGAPETIWLITEHDPRERVVEFVRFTTGLVATRLRIHIQANPDGTSSVHISYTFTPISDAGIAFVMTHHSEEEFHRAMAWWEQSMNHYVKTGESLRRDR
jgi:hypothetical protein